MDSRGVAELVEWAGMPSPSRTGRVASFLVVNALDDFPGAASVDALLQEASRDVMTGAALLAKATAGMRPFVLTDEARCEDLESERGSAPSVGVMGAPALHPLSAPAVMAGWLCEQPRFGGSRPENFRVISADDAAAVAAAFRGRPRLDAWITVAGAVAAPGTFLVPRGTTTTTLVAPGRRPDRGDSYSVDRCARLAATGGRIARHPGGGLDAAAHAGRRAAGAESVVLAGGGTAADRFGLHALLPVR